MIDDRVLMNDWHVVGWTSDVPEGKPVPIRLLGENMVLWRSAGEVRA